MSITAIILTKNEEENIIRCTSSLAWCHEIIIIDDFSEDKTLDRISNKPRIEIFQRHLNGDFAAQRNFGLSKASCDWALFIDADEVVSAELKAEIISTIKSTKNNGFLIKRRDFFLGKWLKYGESSSVVLLRLAKKDAGVWKGRVHEVWHVHTSVAELSNPLLHLPHKNLSSFLKKINYYTDLVAQYWIEQGRQVKFWEIFVYPVAKFFQNYVLRKGFLDGAQGFILAVMMSFHSFLARTKAKTSQNRHA